MKRKRGIKDERIKFSARQQKDRERISSVSLFIFFFTRYLHCISCSADFIADRTSS